MAVEDASPYKCAVSDVRVLVLIMVSEFTSDNVDRVQRHAAKAENFSAFFHFCNITVR